jgi:hypothetical protein
MLEHKAGSMAASVHVASARSAAGFQKMPGLSAGILVGKDLVL